MSPSSSSSSACCPFQVDLAPCHSQLVGGPHLCGAGPVTLGVSNAAFPLGPGFH